MILGLLPRSKGIGIAQDITEMLRHGSNLNQLRCRRYVRLADDDITVGAVIIGTAEYCSEVVGALGRNVAKLLDPPLGDQVRATPLVSGGVAINVQQRSPCPLHERVQGWHNSQM